MLLWDICTIIRQIVPAIPTFQVFPNIQTSNIDSMTSQLSNPFLFIFNTKILSYNPWGHNFFFSHLSYTSGSKFSRGEFWYVSYLKEEGDTSSQIRTHLLQNSFTYISSDLFSIASIK